MIRLRSTLSCVCDSSLTSTADHAGIGKQIKILKAEIEQRGLDVDALHYIGGLPHSLLDGKSHDDPAGSGKFRMWKRGVFLNDRVKGGDCFNAAEIYRGDTKVQAINRARLARHESDRQYQ